MNVVAIIGRLAADPQLRKTNSGKSVCSFRIACNNPGKDAGTSWIDVVAWGNTADFVEKYFTKGKQIAIEGRLQSREYTDKSGNKRNTIEIVANNVDFCGDKGGNTSPSGNADVFHEVDESEDGDLPF